MTTNLAFAPPRPSQPAMVPRHIQIVTTRAQRKARPAVSYAVATVASLFMIFAAQLLLSIVVSDGAYQINSLQAQQRELLRSEQSLRENLDLLGSTQHLATNAAALGMVPAASPLFLDLSSGAISRAPGSIDRRGCGGGCNLVLNDLLGSVPLAGLGGTNQGAATSDTAAQPKNLAPTPKLQPAVTDAIPAPVTH